MCNEKLIAHHSLFLLTGYMLITRRMYLSWLHSQR